MNATEMLRQLRAAQTRPYTALLKLGDDLTDSAGSPAEIFNITTQTHPLSCTELAQPSLTVQPYDLVQIYSRSNTLALIEHWLSRSPKQSDVVLYGADYDLFTQASWRLAQAGFRCLCQSDCGSVFFFTPMAASQQHIVMSATADNYHFAEPVIDLARQEEHRLTALSLSGLTAEGLYGWLRHCDIAWFEWGDSAIIAASHLPKQCRMICRIHRYELYDDVFLRANWANIDEVIFVSEAMKKRFVARLGDKLPATLILSVIANMTPHLPQKKYASRTANPFHIGCVARFVGVKNLFLLLPIMIELLARDKRYRLFIAGRVEDTCLYDSFIEAVEQAGLKSAIRIEGIIPAKEMARWYADKTYLLSTSYNESQGMGIFEAMLAGVKPVAFAATGGLQEYLPSRYQFVTVQDAVSQLTTPAEPREVYAQEATTLLNQPTVAQSYRECLAKPTPAVCFSIIIPVYNRPAFVISAIASALNQNYPDFEVVVVDDGSSDNTVETIENHFNDPRLRIIRKSHTHAPDTRNTGIQHATGDYMVWLDSDDILHRTALSHYNMLLSRWPETDVISCGMRQFGGVDNPTFQPTETTVPALFLDKIAWGNCITNPGSCVKKSVYAQAGGYDCRYLRAHDYEFWTRAAANSKLVCTTQNNILYRLHDNNITGAGHRVDKTYEYRIFQQMVKRYPFKLLFPALSRAQAEKFIALRKAQLEKECELNNLLVVIPAWGEMLNHLDSAFQILSQQHDRDFKICVASDHDLDFLSIPTYRLSERDPQALVHQIESTEKEGYWHIVEMQDAQELSPDAIRTLKNALLTEEVPFPSAFTSLRNRPVLS